MQVAHDWLPSVVNKTLRDLSSRPSAGQLRDTADLVAWLEQWLEFTVACCHPPAPAGAPRAGVAGTGRGFIRHWVKADPHTGSVVALYRTATEQRRVEARHMLWALTHAVDERLTCARIEATLSEWVGSAHPGPGTPWSRSSDRQFRTVRTALRTVQYLDAGFDLFESQRWLAIGVRPETVGWARRALEAFRVDGTPGGEDEQRLIAHIENRTGMNGAQGAGVTVTFDGWMRANVAEWFSRETGMGQSSVIRRLEQV